MTARSRAWLRLICAASYEGGDSATSRADCRIAYAIAVGIPPNDVRPTSGVLFHVFEEAGMNPKVGERWRVTIEGEIAVESDQGVNPIVFHPVGCSTGPAIFPTEGVWERLSDPVSDTTAIRAGLHRVCVQGTASACSTCGVVLALCDGLDEARAEVARLRGQWDWINGLRLDEAERRLANEARAEKAEAQVAAVRAHAGESGRGHYELEDDERVRICGSARHVDYRRPLWPCADVRHMLATIAALDGAAHFESDFDPGCKP